MTVGLGLRGSEESESPGPAGACMAALRLAVARPGAALPQRLKYVKVIPRVRTDALAEGVSTETVYGCVPDMERASCSQRDKQAARPGKYTTSCNTCGNNSGIMLLCQQVLGQRSSTAALSTSR